MFQIQAFERLFDPQIPSNGLMERLILEAESAAGTVRDSSALATRRGIMACVFRLPSLAVYDPRLQGEIRDEYQWLQEQACAVRELMPYSYRIAEEAPLAQINRPGHAKGTCETRHMRMHALYQRLYAFQLSLQAIMNGILQVYEPDDAELREDEIQIAEGVINLVQAGSALKPFGAAWIPFCLMSIWASSTDQARKNRIATVWDAVWGSHAIHSVGEAAEKLAGNLEKLRIEAVQSTSSKFHDQVL
jgi:hypothetical protein